MMTEIPLSFNYGYRPNGLGYPPVYSRLPERPLKILITTDTMGGVWTYTVELARALSRHSYEVAVATMGNPLSQKQHQEIQQIPRMHLFESHYKLEWMDEPWTEVDQAGEWLLALEQQFQPDLVHLNGYAHGALPWRTPTLIVGHSCVLSWWQAVKGEPAPASWKTYRQRIKQGLQSVDLVLAPTRAMLRALECYYGPLPQSQVIPNGRNPAFFHRGKKENFIFTAGRVWDEAKNVIALEEVASRLPWPIYVAGEDKHPSGRTVPLQHLRLLGHLAYDELLPVFARASIYALPARYEPFGLSALEAALSGCALVLGDIPSLREVWGDAALFVPPDDPEALEVALVLLIIDPIYRQRMARRAYERAQTFTSERMLSAYLATYQELVKEYQVIS